MIKLMLLVMTLTAATATAHFKITSPDGGTQEWINTDQFGNPQKESPCGDPNGTQSGFVKTVVAGSKLKLNWLETVPHGGHYRISIAPTRAQLVDPVPVVTSNNCVSLAIQNPPVAPVVADGVHVHAQTSATNVPYETEITIPNTLGANTLQMIQFMRPHAPSCFYYHCVNLNIVAAADAGAPPVPDAGAGGGSGTGGGGGAGGGVAGSGGGVAGTGGGVAGTGGGVAGTGGGSAGAGGGSPGTGGGASGTGGGSSGTGGGSGEAGGCGCTTGTASMTSLLMMLTVGLLLRARRRE